MKISSVHAEKNYQLQPAFAKRKVYRPAARADFAPPAPSEPKEKKKTGKFKQILPYAVMSLAAVGGIAIAYFAAVKKTGKMLDSKSAEFEKLKKGINNVAETMKSKADDPEKIWLAIAALAGFGGFQAGKKITDEQVEWRIDDLVNGRSPLQAAAYGAADHVGALNNIQSNPTGEKYVKDFYGLSLLGETNALNRDKKKYASAIDFIRNAGYEKLTSPELLPPVNKDYSQTSIWSVTSEFAPIKEGGLGSVPVEVRNNIAKLGINIPTFVPMYLHEGISTFSKEDEELVYNYKGKKFNVDKIASFKMDVCGTSGPKTVPVSFYMHTEPGGQGASKQLVFVKCDEYFDGTIYEANSKTEEQEKFAVMSKAVYEFAKLIMDGPKALKDVEIFASSSYREIQPPDALMLNDWQASPLAALARYKSGMENAYGKLSDKTAKALQNMKIVTLGHNVTHQGRTGDNNNDAQRKAATSRILNTLFDKYTFDVVSNAVLNVKKVDPYDSGLETLDNVLLMNHSDPNSNHTNFLNMGVVLSDYFCPVSKNYARELVSEGRNDLSGSLQWALVQKSKAGKLAGVINGNDYNNISLRAKKDLIRRSLGLNFEIISKLSPDTTVLQNRLENKKNFYNNFILPAASSSASDSEQIKKVQGLINGKLEFVECERPTNPPVLSDEEIAKTPFMFFGGRLVGQKGWNVLRESLKMLYDNWEKDFPGRPKPIIYLAGQDGEGGHQRRSIEDFKNYDLSQEDSNRVIFLHGFAPLTAFMTASDYFLMPSLFEPCGLTQSESMAVATPVIASAVGGIVDTLNRDGKENGILTDKDKQLDSYEFYKSMKKGLDIYFNDKPRYEKMVKDSLAEDFSWIQKGKQGPIFEYLDIFGYDRKKLPDVA